MTAQALKVPFFDANTESVEVVAICSEGIAPVKAGEVIAELATSKSVQDAGAPADGYVRLTVAVGDTIRPGEVYAVWGTDRQAVEAFTLEEAAPVVESPAADGDYRLTTGARLALVAGGVTQDAMTAHLARRGTPGGAVSRAVVEAELAAFESIDGPAGASIQRFAELERRLDAAERIAGDHLQAVQNQQVPLWVTTDIAGGDLLERYQKHAEDQGLAGNLGELVLWAALEWLRAEPNLAGFVDQDGRYRWRQPAIAVVVQKPDGALILPTLKPTDGDTPGAVAESFLEVKRRIAGDTLRGRDFEGGGVVLSIIESPRAASFQALPLPHMSFALAVAGPGGDDASISATLTYDHRYTGGAEATRLLERFAAILEGWRP